MERATRNLKTLKMSKTLFESSTILNSRGKLLRWRKTHPSHLLTPGEGAEVVGAIGTQLEGAAAEVVAEVMDDVVAAGAEAVSVDVVAVAVCQGV
mmetsp:Transcript_34552/g.55193  ORF Transcript_34552/g.55193 Transcript_34552/m.55193 type:complete len:95 (-) Transcript_34552:93-377(-)